MPEALTRTQLRMLALLDGDRWFTGKELLALMYDRFPSGNPQGVHMNAAALCRRDLAYQAHNGENGAVVYSISENGRERVTQARASGEL